MKKGLHPAYHFVDVQLNDGTTYRTRTTYGEAGQKVTLDIDPTTCVVVEDAVAGIDAARLRAFGAGPYAPVASNDSEEGRAKNRRVELVKR